MCIVRVKNVSYRIQFSVVVQEMIEPFVSLDSNLMPFQRFYFILSNRPIHGLFWKADASHNVTSKKWSVRESIHRSVHMHIVLQFVNEMVDECNDWTIQGK